jgi:hypothetical protein
LSLSYLLCSEHDEFLSQSARYAENDIDNETSRLSLQGSDLDSLKDFVQNQKKDFEADQAKGRKSPGSLRGLSSNFRTRGGGKILHSRSHSKELEIIHSDQHSDTTEVEKYINSASSASVTATTTGGQSEVSDMILRLASQMDRNEIDKAIAVLEHVKNIAALGESSQQSGNNVKRPVVSSNQPPRRSKSGPPGTSSNRPPYPYSSSVGSALQQPSKSDNRANFSSIDHYDDDEEAEPELLVGDEMEDDIWLMNANIFRPPSAHNIHNHVRSESEMSFTSTNNSRSSTPMHKRSPTPNGITIPPSINIEVHDRDLERQQCPVVERPHKQSPIIRKTEFYRLNVPGLSRENSNSANGLGSPRSQANDDVVSVVSSNSSFTAVTSNSAGCHSLSANR